MTAVVGSVISCNILTPLIRNIIGSKWQKKLNAETMQSTSQIMDKAQLTPTQPLAMKLNTPSLNKTYPQRPVTSVYSNFYSSSMKI